MSGMTVISIAEIENYNIGIFSIFSVEITICHPHVKYSICFPTISQRGYFVSDLSFLYSPWRIKFLSQNAMS